MCARTHKHAHACTRARTHTGHSYEKVAIEAWLATGHTTSPKTNEELAHRHVVPNHTLKSIIREHSSAAQKRT
jgi:hypothetical protein